ncbi:exodeoxyribonuclease V subunit alpha [Acinetobacter cumulans]|uniref:exodeoxyribonuclease V subunit alpha n=1 Tax=Acinetobacter cumulans TaxID=2136182 RepID=UPI00269FA743
MENDQKDLPMQAWAKYVSLQHSSALMREKATVFIQQIFQALAQGDSCLPCTESELQLLAGLYATSEDAANQQIAPFVYDQQQIYLYRYWSLEFQLAQYVATLKQQQLPALTLSPQQEALLEDTQQKQAMRMVASQALSIITGGPGTGKTYTLARIIAVLNQSLPNIRIAMAAPTGKAAQRMKEALQNSFSDPKLADLISDDLKRLTPITLHRLLGLGETQRPRFHAKRPLPFDVIVVDEASMLDLNLAKMLLAAVAPQTRLILLGDADQLASVDVGSVLADLQQVPALAENHVHLVTSRRFDGEQLIGRMAQFIQQNRVIDGVLQQFEQALVPAGELGEIALTDSMHNQIQLQYLPEQESDITLAMWSRYYDQLMFGFSGYCQALVSLLQQTPKIKDVAEIEQVIARFDDYRVLSAIRHGNLGLNVLNEQIEQRVLEATQQAKQGEWYVGRPVMMTYNDYQLGLSNGDIGICFQQQQQGQIQFAVYFPSLQKWVAAARLPKSIQTAYALTIHKSQGSEFTHTVVVLDANAQQLLSKELIYTAITRAKKVVSILAARSSLANAMSVRTLRRSGLSAKVATTLS